MEVLIKVADIGVEYFGIEVTVEVILNKFH